MKRAVVFPGQGAQKIGMAIDLAGEFPEVAELLKTADQVSGLPISEVMAQGPTEQLSDTSFSQPALVVADLAAFMVFEKIHGPIKPVAMAGLSLGEYAALAAGGALSPADALRLVSLRGKYMSECCAQLPGSMASILGLSSTQVASCVSAAVDAGVVVVANYNSPKQTVISGELAAVERACDLCRDAGAKRAIMLKVSGGFHSPLMQMAADKLAPEIEKAEISSPTLPVLANVSGQLVSEPSEIKRLLLEQVTGSVQWVKTLETMQALGAQEFLELGPGKVLSGLLKRTLEDVKPLAMGTLEEIKAYG
jgi:[acyl-carrier-protein] S-malonyltransferase